MHYELTAEQQALRKQFDDFFREEMKNAPVDYSIHGPSESRYGTKEGYEFHCYMKKKLAEKGWLQEKGKLNFSPAAASEGKVFGSELGQRIANAGTEILGLYGQLEPSRWAPMNGTWADRYQNCLGSNIAGGSSEVQRNIIAWVGVELPRV